MKYLTYAIIALLCAYSILDISFSVFSYKQSQIGYNPQQIALMDSLVESENK